MGRAFQIDQNWVDVNWLRSLKGHSNVTSRLRGAGECTVSIQIILYKPDRVLICEFCKSFSLIFKILYDI